MEFNMARFNVAVFALTLFCCIFVTAENVWARRRAPGFTNSFMIENCGSFANSGSNPFFILEPGYQLNYQGRDDGESVSLSITVLNETEVVDGVETRVVEEREFEGGELIEVSRNFFAICSRTNSVFYFGEDVDIYKNGQIANHDGAWRAGVNGNRPGILMPGTVLLGSKYYQEIATDVALDRAENVSLTQTVETAAGTFENCLKVIETSPLEPGHKSLKWYAPGVGLIKDGPLSLTSVVNSASAETR